MIELAIRVIEAEQQRADDIPSFVEAKAANNAIGRAIILHLLHRGAFAGPIGQVEPLGNNAVERRSNLFQPLLGIG